MAASHSFRITLSLAALCVLGTSTQSRADEIASEEAFQGYTRDDWPLQLTLRPLGLAQGMLQAGGDTVFIGASSRGFGQPLALAPDIEYGVTRWLTLGFQHDIGLCIADAGCTSAYNDTRFGALIAPFQSKPFVVAASLGLAMPRLIAPVQSGLETGLIARFGNHRVALRVEPRVYWALSGNSDEMGDDDELIEGLSNTLEFPAELQFQITPQLVVSATGGLTGPLSRLSNSEVSAGLAVLIVFNHRIDLGTEFRFTALRAQAGGKRSDERVLLLRWAVRLHVP